MGIDIESLQKEVDNLSDVNNLSEDVNISDCKNENDEDVTEKYVRVRNDLEDLKVSRARLWILLRDRFQKINIKEESTCLEPQCPICYDCKIEICIVPCGHTLCSKCIIKSTDRSGPRCPICRSALSKEQPIFF